MGALGGFREELSKTASLSRAGLALSVASQVANHALVHHIGKQVDGPLSSKERDEKIRKALLKASPVKVEHNEKIRFGEYRVGEDKVVVAPDAHPAILAHELGHAELAHTDLGPLLQNRLTVSAANASASPITSAFFGVMGGARDSKLLSAVPSLARIPQLAYEAAASYKGLDRLAKAGATSEELERARDILLRAYATYATDTGTTTGTAMMGHDLGRRLATAG